MAQYLFEQSAELRLVDRAILDWRGERMHPFGIVNAPRRALAAIIAEIAPGTPCEEMAEHLIASIYGAAKLRAVRAGFIDGDLFEDAATLANSLADFAMHGFSCAEQLSD